MMWDKVLRTDDCWLWTGPLDPDGYGILKVDGRSRGTHRLVYEARYARKAA